MSMMLMLSWRRAAHDGVPSLLAAHEHKQHEPRESHDFSSHAMPHGEEEGRGSGEFHLAPNTLPRSQELIHCEIRVPSNNTPRRCRHRALASCKICGAKST